MKLFDWLKENNGYLIPFFFIIILFLLFLTYWWWKLTHQKKVLQKSLDQHKKKVKKIKNKEEDLKIWEQKLNQEDERIKNFTKQLLLKEELFTQQLIANSRHEEKIQAKLKKIEEIKKQVINNLETTFALDIEQAKNILFSLLKEELEPDLNEYKEERVRQIENRIKEISTKIICSALEKYSSELVFSKTTDALKVENRNIVSKIIGKEGRNINAFRRITGTDLIIDEEGEKGNWTLQISSFNSLRREIAGQTLLSLIKEERISPAQIEKTYQEITADINSLIKQTGEEVLSKLELTGVHPELVKYLGKLKYRTSYGQNVLQHSLEVAKLAGNIATELGLNVLMARRAGLFHDIGKASEDNEKYSHVINGVNLAKKYNEPEIVINAIASHHRNTPANNLYSLIVMAADTLSAARPGARGYQLEAYLERMNSLEKITNEFPGIKKSYAFQAGREIWIIADAEKLNDHQTWELSRKVKKKIEENVIIPGEVTIYVIREKRFTRKIGKRD